MLDARMFIPTDRSITHVEHCRSARWTRSVSRVQVKLSLSRFMTETRTDEDHGVDRRCRYRWLWRFSKRLASAIGSWTVLDIRAFNTLKIWLSTFLFVLFIEEKKTPNGLVRSPVLRARDAVPDNLVVRTFPCQSFASVGDNYFTTANVICQPSGNVVLARHQNSNRNAMVKLLGAITTIRVPSIDLEEVRLG